MPSFLAIAAQDEPAILKILSGRPEYVNETDLHGNTVLNTGLATGMKETVIRALIEAGADCNLRNKRGATPLISAIYANMPPLILKLLIDSGANVNYQNDNGGTALAVACTMNLPFASVQVLIDAGANVDLSNFNGYTALMLGIRNKCDNSILALIIKQSKDIDAQVKMEDLKFPGYTALHFACAMENVVVVSLLVGAKANQTIKNGLNEIPIQLGSPAVSKALQSGTEADSVIKTANVDAKITKTRRVSMWQQVANPIFHVLQKNAKEGEAFHKTTGPGSPAGEDIRTVFDDQKQEGASSGRKKGGRRSIVETLFGGAGSGTGFKSKLVTLEEEEGAANNYDDEQRIGRATRVARGAKPKAGAVKVNKDFLKFPQHTDVPKINVFEGKRIFDPTRLLYSLENHLMTPASVMRAAAWRPKKNDVIVTSGPASGAQLVARIVRFLQSGKYAEVALDKKGLAPWLESRYNDEDTTWLEKGQGNATGRVFVTQCALENSRVRSFDHSVKYLVVVRHPLDFRWAWYQYLRDCYNVPLQDSDLPHPDFDELFTPEDFFECEITLFDGVGGGSAATKRDANNTARTYEQFIYDWLMESQRNPGQVNLIFLEALISAPTKEIKRIAEYLDFPCDDEAASIIAKDLSILGLGPEMISKNVPGGKKKALRKQSTFGAAATGQMVQRRFSAGHGASHFSYKRQYKSQIQWLVISDRVKNCESYEALYKMAYGENYPCPQVKGVTVVTKGPDSESLNLCGSAKSANVVKPKNVIKTETPAVSDAKKDEWRQSFKQHNQAPPSLTADQLAQKAEMIFTRRKLPGDVAKKQQQEEEKSVEMVVPPPPNEEEEGQT